MDNFIYLLYSIKNISLSVLKKVGHKNVVIDFVFLQKFECFNLLHRQLFRPHWQLGVFIHFLGRASLTRTLMKYLEVLNLNISMNCIWSTRTSGYVVQPSGVCLIQSQSSSRTGNG